MKKLHMRIYFLIAAITLLTSFASCGPKDQPDTPEDIPEEDEDDGITRHNVNYLRDAEYDGVYITDEYEEPQTITLDAEIRNMRALHIFDDKIWISDSIFNNDILIFDMFGNLIKKSMI